jgi:hypothetical protein
MNAIQQTVEVPANRRLTLEVPREIPVGKVILTFTPASPEEERTREVARNHAAWDTFFAALDAAPPLPGEDMPPRLNFRRELPL